MEGIIYPSDEKTAAYLESLVSEIVKTIESRTVADDSPGWRCMSNDFSIRSDLANTSSKEQTIQYVRYSYEMSPLWGNRIMSMSTQFDSGSASVFVNSETDGLPEGLTKSMVLVFTFKQNAKGEWLATGVTTLVGHEMDSSVGLPSIG